MAEQQRRDHDVEAAGRAKIRSNGPTAAAMPAVAAVPGLNQVLRDCFAHPIDQLESSDGDHPAKALNLSDRGRRSSGARADCGFACADPFRLTPLFGAPRSGEPEIQANAP